MDETHAKFPSTRKCPLLPLLFLLATLVRLLTLRLGTDVDTGSFLVQVVAMAEGRQLYAEIFTKHMPLTFLLGRLLHILSFGHFVAASRLTMVLVSASCVIPVFLLGRALFGKWAGVAAGLFLALDPLSVFYARQLHVSALEAVAATWVVWLMLLTLRLSRHRATACFATGMAVGLAFLVKQSAVALGPLYLLLSFILSPELRISASLRRALKDILPYVLGGVIILAAAAWWMAGTDILRDFWSCAVTANFELRRAGLAPGRITAWLAKIERCARIAGTNWWLWLFAAYGGISVLRAGHRRALAPLLWLAGLGGFLFIFYYEAGDHYFLAWAAPASLLAGHGLVLFIGLWQESIARDRLARGTVGVLLFLALLLLGLAAKLFHLHRIDYALLGCAASAAVLVRLVLNRPDKESRRTPLREAALVVLYALILVCVAVPYWTHRRAYPEPYVSVSMEKSMAEWVGSRLKPGEDVAMIACNVMTLYGGWRELPVVHKGKTVIWPMGIENAFRDWSPAPRRLSDTIALWEKKYNVRFIVLYDDYLRTVQQAAQTLPLKEYLREYYSLVKRFDWDTGDYYGRVRVFQRKAPGAAEMEMGRP